MFNTNLKILAKVLADHLQTALFSVIGPEQCCAVKGWTIQSNFHLVHTIIENVDGDAVNLDQSKAFNRVDHGFLEAVLFMVGFRFHFRSWVRLLHASPIVVLEVNGIRSKPFVSIDSSRLSALAHALYSCAGTLSAQVEGELVLRSLTLPVASLHPLMMSGCL